MSIVLKKHIRSELNRLLQDSDASRSVKKLINRFDSIANETVDYMGDIIENGHFSSLQQVEDEAENQAFKLFNIEEVSLKIEECEERKAELTPHVDPNDPAQYDDPRLEEISNLDSQIRALKLKLQGI